MTVRSIPWLRIVIEGVVIVGSILLAFGIDAWWEGRQERAEEASIVAAIHSDFVANQQQLETRIGQYERAFEGVEGFGRQLRDAAGSSSITVPDSVMASLLTSPTYDPFSGALNSLVSAGNLDLIRDPDLRRLLASWEALVADAREDQVMGQSLSTDEITPLLRDQSDLWRVFDGLPAWTTGADLPQDFREGQSQVVPTRSLLSLIGERRFWLDNSIFEMRFLRAVQDSILTLTGSE